VLVGVGWWRGPLWRGGGGGGGTILWCRVRLGQGGEGWRRPCLGGGRDEVGGYGRVDQWIIVDGRSVAQGMMSDSRSAIPYWIIEDV